MKDRNEPAPLEVSRDIRLAHHRMVSHPAQQFFLSALVAVAMYANWDLVLPPLLCLTYGLTALVLSRGHTEVYIDRIVAHRVITTTTVPWRDVEQITIEGTRSVWLRTTDAKFELFGLREPDLQGKVDFLNDLRDLAVNDGDLARARADRAARSIIGPPPDVELHRRSIDLTIRYVFAGIVGVIASFAALAAVTALTSEPSQQVDAATLTAGTPYWVTVSVTGREQAWVRCPSPVSWMLGDHVPMCASATHSNALAFTVAGGVAALASVVFLRLVRGARVARAAYGFGGTPPAAA